MVADLKVAFTIALEEKVWIVVKNLAVEAGKDNFGDSYFKKRHVVCCRAAQYIVFLSSSHYQLVQ